MCFYIHNKHTQPKIAKRDIVCYKRTQRDLRPLFLPEYDPYVLGELNPLVILEHGVSYINKGYHSYSNRKTLNKNKKFLIRVGWDSIGVKCIIPKGTRYYYNPVHKEYVSETIIIKEKL